MKTFLAGVMSLILFVVVVTALGGWSAVTRRYFNKYGEETRRVK